MALDPSSLDTVLAYAESLHAQGNLSDAETLYREILTTEPNHARAIHNLGVIALRMGHAAGAEQLLRRAIVLESDMAEAYSNLGLVLAGSARSELARACFARAVELRPDYADAWSNLGILEQSAGETAAAIGHFRRARAANPDNSAIAGNLAACLIEVGKLDEGVALLEELGPQLQMAPAYHFNLAKARFSQGDLSNAVNGFRQAIALDPDSADSHHTLAHALLASGELAEGWREYGWRWRAKRFRVPPRDFPIPRWTGEDLAGKRVLVWSEQGIGDKLLFAGLFPELAARADAVTVEIEERLVALYRRSFPAINVIARRDPVDPALDPAGFDLQAPLGDLARYLRPTLDGFRPLGAYLAPDADRTRDLRSRYRRGEAPLIGIAWASRPPKGLPLDAFASMLKLAGARWISLQYGDRSEEIARVNQALDTEIVEDRTIDAVADFDGSVAQTAALDAVVTIQNATLYTAGGLGLPTFALTPPEPDWRWLGCDYSPWHDTVRLYRQDREGPEAALKRMAGDFADWLGQCPR
jgi:Flp pilus assembly protein TadD